MNINRNAETQNNTNAPEGMTQEQWQAYQRYIDAQLPASPLKGLIGLCVAFVVGMAFFMFPWFISWMQDEGIIRPQLHLRMIPSSSRTPYGSPD